MAPDRRGRHAGGRGLRVVITCEHGGNLIPRDLAWLFEGRRALLNSHRGWDPGALELAGRLAVRMRAPLRFALVSRLVVDLNRSTTSPELLAGPTARLAPASRRSMMARYYFPYRREIERLVTARRSNERVLHLSVHTFTPVLRGERRAVDIGLLFDPERELERTVVDAIRSNLRKSLPRLRIRLNAPYRGTDDGLTTHLRTLNAANRYAGIELEVNQRLVRARTPTGGARWNQLQIVIAEAVASAVESLR